MFRVDNFALDARGKRKESRTWPGSTALAPRSTAEANTSRRVFLGCTHTRTRASARTRIMNRAYGSWLQYTDNSVHFHFLFSTDRLSFDDKCLSINCRSIIFFGKNYVFIFFFLYVFLFLAYIFARIVTIDDKRVYCATVRCALRFWYERWIRWSVFGLLAQILIAVITGADWKKKRGCINLHAGSNYSRIALHNVTILQGVALNSFHEDNAMCCGKMDKLFRRIFFFFQIPTLFLSLSRNATLFCTFFFFWFRLWTKILLSFYTRIRWASFVQDER